MALVVGLVVEEGAVMMWRDERRDECMGIRMSYVNLQKDAIRMK